MVYHLFFLLLSLRVRIHSILILNVCKSTLALLPGPDWPLLLTNIKVFRGFLLNLMMVHIL